MPTNCEPVQLTLSEAGAYNPDAFAARSSRVNATVGRIIGLQALLTVIVALALLGMKGGLEATSALFGGAIGFIASLVYALTMSFPRSSDPNDVLKAHYRAEVYKLVATFLLFVAVFSLFPNVSALIVLLAFAGTLAVYWAALLMI